MTDIEGYAELISETIRSADEGFYDGEECDDAVERFLNDCLDLKALVSYSVYGVQRTEAVEILRSYGGPTCWISVQSDDEVRVAVYDGSDRTETRVLAPRFAEVAFEAAQYVVEEATS